jgi:hypothetical protein
MYIGPDKIKSTEDAGDSVKVYFENKKEPIILKRKMYEKSIWTEPMDATQLRERQLLPIMEDVVKVFTDWDVKLCDIDPLFMRIVSFINDKLSYASAKVWMPHIKNKPLSEKWHHSEVERERTIGDLNSVFENGDTGKNQNISSIQGKESGAKS